MTSPKSLEPPSRRTEATILGQRLSLRLDDDPEQVERVVRYVQRKASELDPGGPVPPAKLALLLALNIADDHLRALDAARGFKREVAARSRAILADLDES